MRTSGHGCHGDFKLLNSRTFVCTHRENRLFCSLGITVRTMFCCCIIGLLATFLSGPAQAQTANCPADLNYDRWVDSADLSQQLLDFGDCFECAADLDANGSVDSGDVSLMLLDFGACPGGPSDNPCPPWGTVIEPGGPEDILFNGLVVGVRWWDEVSTGWQRFTSSAPEGECTTYSTNYRSVCLEAGTVIAVDAQFTYYADGNCAYYTGPTTPPNPCPTAKTIALLEHVALMVTPSEGGCAESYQVGRAWRILYHDGNCGTYWGWLIWHQYKPLGVYLGACGTWMFFSNGAGGYYIVRNCPPAGTVLSEVSRTPYTVQVEGGYEWTLGYQVVALETDGECGEREVTRYEWLPYGTILGTDGTYDYYSDGNGWYYTEPSGCPTAGTVLSTSSEPIMAGPNGNDWQVGTNDTTVYADGSCGSNSEFNQSYLSYGTFLGNDGAYNYYSDGAGGYYTEPSGCPTAGTVLSTSSEPIMAGPNGNDWQVGTNDTTVYADGSCGSNSEFNQSYLSYGTFLGNDGSCDYFSNGTGGYYTSNCSSGVVAPGPSGKPRTGAR